MCVRTHLLFTRCTLLFAQWRMHTSGHAQVPRGDQAPPSQAPYLELYNTLNSLSCMHTTLPRVNLILTNANTRTYTHTTRAGPSSSERPPRRRSLPPSRRSCKRTRRGCCSQCWKGHGGCCQSVYCVLPPRCVSLHSMLPLCCALLCSVGHAPQCACAPSTSDIIYINYIQCIHNIIVNGCIKERVLVVRLTVLLHYCADEDADVKVLPQVKHHSITSVYQYCGNSICSIPCANKDS